jgi:O-antigen/teichoic acid export membrane protein
VPNETTLERSDLRLRGAHSTGSRLVQNTVSNIAGQSFIVVLTFLSTPYITRKMGATQYGTLSLLMTYLFAFSLLNLGINASLVKYIAELMPKGQMKDVQEYFSTSLTVLVGIGVLIALFVCFLAPAIVRTALKGQNELTGSAVLALRIASIAFVLQFLTQVLSAVPAAAQRFEIVNLVRAGTEGLRLLGTVALLHFGRGLPYLMAMVLLSSLAGCVVFAIISKRLMPTLNLAPGFSKNYFSSLFGHSKYIVVTNASNQAVSAADTFLIGLFLPVANVAYYAIAYTLAQRMWSFVANVVAVVFPAASAFSGVGNTEQLGELYVRAMKLSVAIGCFPAVAICIFSRPFLLLWLGPDYANKGSTALVVLTVGFLINSFSYVAYQMLQGARHADIAAKGAVIYVIVNLTLFLILIPTFGILGASAGFLMAQLLFVPWFITKANALLGISWGPMLKLAYLPSFVCAAIAAVICLAFLSSVHSFLTLALAVGFGMVVYTGLGIRFVLDARDREAARLMLQRWTHALKGVTC